MIIKKNMVENVIDNKDLKIFTRLFIAKEEIITLKDEKKKQTINNREKIVEIERE